MPQPSSPRRPGREVTPGLAKPIIVGNACHIKVNRGGQRRVHGSANIVANEARIEPYLKRLFGYAFSLSRDRHRAEDLVQECALRALSARNMPVDEPAYKSWLFRILKNAFIDHLRRDHTAAGHLVDAGSVEHVEFWQGDERFITTLTVKIEMEKLPPTQQEILGLIDIAGLSYAEAALSLGVPVGTVMSRISRARRALLEAVSLSNVHELPVKKKKGIR
jgi:RNA polymerase sigma-70 factor (ECF subfamily)